MKPHFLTTVAISTLAMAAPAMAAPPPPPVYNWTGFYAGGNVGYSWGDVKSSFFDPGFPAGFGFGPGGDLPSSFPTSLKPDGIIGGVQFGYNWQLNDRWLLGLEADFQGSDEKARISFSNNYSCDFEGFIRCDLGQTRQAKIHWFDTVRGRIGWLVTPTTFVYGTGGLAFGKVSLSGTITDDVNNTGASFRFEDSQVKFGYAVGGGIEGAFPNSKNWTWKVEYLYIDLGSLSGSGIEPITGSAYKWDARFTDNILRVGFNYRFRP
jgi:outer membrane immunogenic protein